MTVTSTTKYIHLLLQLPAPVASFEQQHCSHLIQKRCVSLHNELHFIITIFILYFLQEVTTLLHNVHQSFEGKIHTLTVHINYWIKVGPMQFPPERARWKEMQATIHHCAIYIGCHPLNHHCVNME